MSASKKIVLDSVHGTISFENVLFRIVDTEEFQRLRNVRQLETITYLYPSACHSRFEHSIGTCYLAGEFIEHLEKQQPEMMIDRKDVLCVKIAALCHDLGHGPFSHLFEEAIKRIYWELNPQLTLKQAGKIFQHEKASLAIFDRIFDKLQNSSEFKEAGLNNQDREFIKELIKPTILPEMIQQYNEIQSNSGNKRKIDAIKKKIEKLNKELLSKCGRSKDKAFLFEIVSNPRNNIDVDKWDYFARDALNLGIRITFDQRRFILSSRIINPDDTLNQICVRDKELRNIYEMFRTREDLYRRAYQHAKSVSIKEMMIDILKLLDPIVGFMDIVKGLPATLDRYLDLDDRVAYLATSLVTERLITNQQMHNTILKARALVERLNTRRLYKLVGRQIVNNNMKLCPNEALKRIVEMCNHQISFEDFSIVELRVNFGNKDRDPLENVKFFKKGTFEIIDRQKIPEYMSEMRPKKFEEVYWNLYLKNESLAQKSELILKVSTIFEEFCKKDLA